MNTLIAISTDQMLRSLNRSFPDLWCRPLSEFGLKWAGCEGVWAGGDAEMPDGLPVFAMLHAGTGKYDGDVHIDFKAWLHARGWSCENYDGETYHLRPVTNDSIGGNDGQN